MSPEPMLVVEVGPPLRDLQGRFARMEGEILVMRRDHLRMLGPQFVNVAREEAPKGKTEKFSRGIAYRIRESVGGTELQVVSPSPLGSFIKLGTEPHEIRPVQARVLHWVAESGEDVFAMRVQHPGTAPNPYHERTLARMMPELRRLGKTYIRKIVDRLAGKAA